MNAGTVKLENRKQNMTKETDDLFLVPLVVRRENRKLTLPRSGI